MCKYEWISIVAVIVAPIVAVVIGQFLQTRSKKREDKMRIFTVLMNTRIYLWTEKSVEALNMIDIVFVNDKKVRAAWAELSNAYNSSEESAQMDNKRMMLKYKLLEEMAHCLGYKDKITWDTIQNPYMPKAMSDELKKQEQFKNGQLALSELVQKMNGVQPNHTADTTEDKK